MVGGIIMWWLYGAMTEAAAAAAAAAAVWWFRICSGDAFAGGGGIIACRAGGSTSGSMGSTFAKAAQKLVVTRDFRARAMQPGIRRVRAARKTCEGCYKDLRINYM